MAEWLEELHLIQLQKLLKLINFRNTISLIYLFINILMHYRIEFDA